MLGVAYLFCWASWIKNITELGHVWERGIEPLVWLGGGWAPVYAIARAFGKASFFVYLNPFVYISDGLRQIVVPSFRYVSLPICSVVVLVSTVIFILFSYVLLKRRMDIV